MPGILQARTLEWIEEVDLQDKQLTPEPCIRQGTPKIYKVGENLG